MAAPKSDGCTLVPDWDFRKCCEKHDADYAVGGSFDDRAKADADLRKCILNPDKKWKHIYRWPLAYIYWAGVRIFGSSFWPRAWKTEKMQWSDRTSS